MQFSSSWLRFFFPIIMLCMVWIGISTGILMTLFNTPILYNLPYILFFIAIVIAQIFKQSRIGMIACAQFICYFIIQHRLQIPIYKGTALLELSLLSFLFPIACVISHAFRNTSLITKGFAVYLAILGLFFVWALLIMNYDDQGGFSDGASGLLTSIPQFSLLPFILVLYLTCLVGISAILLLNKNRQLDAVIYTSVLFSACVFIFFHTPHISSILFSLSGVMVILYLISAGHKMAFNDRLTDLPGRTALEIELKHVGRKFSIAMLDVDHFKKFNDTYGHDTGDDVLKLVATLLQQVNGRAKAYRYGGEEFTIIFKGKYAEEAQPYLETLRQNIQDYEMILRNMVNRPQNSKQGQRKRGNHKPGNKVVNVTISIGVSDSRSSRNSSEVLKYADQALYKAKKAGRNCVKILQTDS
jgi:diguanylate cyclase (GGDEF)-like protein